MSDLVKRLRDGCVRHEKRWSGDTHFDKGGIVDEVATDKLCDEAADEIEALKTSRETWIRIAAKLQKQVAADEAENK